MSEGRDIDLNIRGGSLEFLSTSSTSTFDLIKITGNQVISSTSFNGSLLVGDSRDTGEGLRLQVIASQFEEVEPEGGFAVGTQPFKLLKGVLSLKPVNSIEQVSGGDNVLPSVVMDSEQVIDIDGFVTLVSAGLNEGMGAFEIRFPSDALTVALDPSMKVIDTVNYPLGVTSYKSLLTFILVTGP